jgi:hypothetical protein
MKKSRVKFWEDTPKFFKAQLQKCWHEASHDVNVEKGLGDALTYVKKTHLLPSSTKSSQVSIYVITDAQWDGPGPAGGAENPVCTFIEGIKGSVMRTDVSIQFIQVNPEKDGAAEERLRYLDERLGKSLNL